MRIFIIMSHADPAVLCTRENPEESLQLQGEGGFWCACCGRSEREEGKSESLSERRVSLAH